jgi:hypothetical protein
MANGFEQRPPTQGDQLPFRNGFERRPPTYEDFRLPFRNGFERRSSSGAATLLGILIGLIIGLPLVYFLFVALPHGTYVQFGNTCFYDAHYYAYNPCYYRYR